MKFRTLEELEFELEIDEGNLEEEMVKQSQLYYEASRGFADAFSKADGAKMILEKVEGELSRELKSSSLESKITTKDMETFVYSNPTYLAQKQLQIDMKTLEYRWKGLMNAYEQRGDRLRDLVFLMNMGYYNSGLIANEDMKKKFSDKYQARNTSNGGNE